MCNLYALTRGQDAMRQLFAIAEDRLGNLGPLPAIFPDQMAPVIRVQGGRRTAEMMRWGFPPPPAGNRPVTNVRNTASPFWRPWLGPAQRCLVPVTAFCEYADTRPRKTPVWFALDAGRPLMAFAGIWRDWEGVRGGTGAPMRHRLFAFLTCPPNREVGLVHPKAMPVILTEPAEMAAWLTAPVAAARALQRPLADGRLIEVARGTRQDPGPEAGDG